MNENAEVTEVDTSQLASFGAGSGSRSSHKNSQGRLGNKNANKGSVTRTRNRIAAAQAGNKGKGKKSRQNILNDLATTARGNTRGNVNRRTVAGLNRQIADIERQLRGNGARGNGFGGGQVFGGR